MKREQVFATAAAVASATVLVACGGGGSTGSTMPPATMPPMAAPAIAQQPMGQSVPMGRSASFSVTASGTAIHYQWLRGGTPISGANSSAYTTPPTAFADSGSTYSVIVSNSGGSVTSAVASLTVTARAPAQGDLRFQQVDADSTVSGYGNPSGLSTALSGRTGMYFSPSVGTSFYVGPGNCANPPTLDGVGCAWFFSEDPVASPGLSAAYAADFYDSFSQDLQGDWPAFGNGLRPTSSHSVITSLDLEPADILFALAWVQDDAQDGFTALQRTVAPADLASAAAAEGAASRVITAISHKAGQITYFAYAWQSDTTTIYETQIVTGSADKVVGQAADLAAQGYIITATGVADDIGTVVLVGTRVQGDTLPRPFIAAQGGAQIVTMQSQGYATVGVIFNPATTLNYTFLGER